MCASLIIDTSLAPSPIAAVIIYGSFVFTSLTTSAFYPGLTLQQMTASHYLANYTNLTVRYISERILANADASTIKPLFACVIGLVCNKTVSISWIDFSLSTSNYGVINLHDRPIFSAVSNLSPVSIHILIPAYCKSDMVSGTQSCN